MEKPKICAECKHVREYIGSEILRCGASGEIDIITGRRKLSTCEGMRVAGAKCGPEGRLWEQSEPAKIAGSAELLKPEPPCNSPLLGSMLGFFAAVGRK